MVVAVEDFRSMQFGVRRNTFSDSIIDDFVQVVDQLLSLGIVENQCR